MADHKTSDLTDGVEIESGDLMHVARGSNSVKVILGSAAGQDTDNVEFTGGTVLLDVGTTVSQKGKPTLDVFLDTTLTGNIGTGTTEQDMLSGTYDAGALSVANNELIIHAYGAKGINTNTAVVRAYLTDGTTNLLIGVIGSSATNTVLEYWEANFKITSSGVGVQQIWSKMERWDENTTADLAVRNIIAGALDDTQPLTIKFTVQMTNGGGGIATANCIQDYLKGSFTNG